jgi:DNA segregation ATPase FtsK/SpoIIIE, S-DNA-T family
MPPKKEKKSPESTSSGGFRATISQLVAAVKSDQFRHATGLFLVLFAGFMAIAFTSFFFTWKVDQSHLSGSWWEFMMNSDIAVENWLGKIGAWLSHLFIHSGFGVMSFAFVLLTGLLGFRLMLGQWLMPIKRIVHTLLWLFLLIPFTLSFLFGHFAPFLGGAFGFAINSWFKSALGATGTGLFLGFAWLGYAMVRFKIAPTSVVHMFQNLFGSVAPKLQKEKSPNGFETTAEESIQDNLMEDDEASDDIIDDLLYSDDEEEIDEEESLEFTTNQPLAENQDDDGFDDLDIDLPPEMTAGDDELEVEVREEEALLSETEIESRLKDLGEYDPKLDLSSYEFPRIDLLQNHGGGQINVNKEELEANKNNIVQTLANYKIGIAKIKATIGPTVTLYEIVPEAGVRISKIKNLEDDIALNLAALGIRIIAPIPGRGTIGIEVPNSKADVVSMRTLIASDKFQNNDFELPLALGKTISNETFVADLAKMPHLLMAGATGQGKSVGLNAILVSLLYKKHPSQIKFVLVDPKKVELTLFNKIERHYLAKLPDTEESIITDTKKVVNTLNSLCIEMDQRYDLLKTAHVRNLKEYNTKFVQRKLNPENGHRFLPYIILVVDEFADLIMTAGKEVETPIARLAQLARAIGIHLIIATQRPSVNVITGIIKANFPARIAFRVTSKIDSRTILDTGGADQLIGRGDMLLSQGNDIIRLQCGFVDTPEVEEITEFIGNQRGYPSAYLLPEYSDEVGEGSIMDDGDRDSMFEDAARIVVIHQQGSASLLQRKLKLGYNRAGRIVDQLEAAGIIGPFEGSKARQVLIPDEHSLEQLLNRGKNNDY